MLAYRFTAFSEVNTTVVARRSKPTVFAHEHADYVGVKVERHFKCEHCRCNMTVRPTQRPVRMADCHLYLNGQRSSRDFLPLFCGSWADNDLSYRVPEEVGNLHFCAECSVAFLGCTVSTALSWPQGLLLSPTCTRMRKIQTRCFWLCYASLCKCGVALLGCSVSRALPWPQRASAKSQMHLLFGRCQHAQDC